MKVVYLNNNSSVLPIKQGLVLALGYFDGLHLAHQHLINKTLEIAKNDHLKSGVMTFSPSPKQFLGKQEVEHLLTPHNMKIDLLDKMGVDYLFVVNFDADIAKIHHDQFIDQFILPLNIKHIVTGFDYKYGYKGKGNIKTLSQNNEQYDVTVIDEMTLHGEKISSSKIRELILSGQVYEVYDLLGRFYQTEGIVIHGFKRGRELGFPTANVSAIDDYLIPQNGVYIVKAEVFQTQYYGMCNVGYNPTFSNNNNKSVEVYILNFNKDIYNEKVTITWIKKIRDERKFSGPVDLVNQLNKDKEVVLEFIEKNN